MLRGLLINDIEDSNEVMLLNKKREKPKETENRPRSNSRLEKGNIINQPLFEAEGIEFEQVIVDAFHDFLNAENQKFIDKFHRLESFKNSKVNEIPIMQEAIPENNNPLIVEETILSEEDNLNPTVNTKSLNEYKTKDEYYNKNSNQSEQDRGDTTEKLNNSLKNELKDIQQFNKFEKSINNFRVRKDSENQYDIEVKIDSLQTEERKEKKRDKKRRVVLASCTKCLGAKLNEYSIISQSDNVYLCYPFLSGSLTYLHIVISTKEHVNSFASVEEDTFIEIRNYMKSIVAFNLERDMSTIFIEFGRNAHSVAHMEIECIPIKHKLVEDAKMYFKKAFTDQDYFWKSNKDIVDTTPFKGNLTKILNEKFSYVYADFDAQGGILHPIEDERRFSVTFLREIFCPLLKKEVHEIKYPKKLGMKELLDTVDEYKKKFEFHDWTKY